MHGIQNCWEENALTASAADIYTCDIFLFIKKMKLWEIQYMYEYCPFQWLL